MPINVTWYDDRKTILLYAISDNWSLNDAWQVLNELVPQHHAEVDYVTDVIIDFREARKIPAGVMNFWRRAFNWMQEKNRETAFIAVVQAPPIITGIGDTLRGLRAPIMKRVVFVNSMDEAQTVIDNHRATTPRIHLNN